MISKIKTVIMSIALVLLLVGNVFAWTTNPLRAGQDGGGSWRLTTIPEEVYDFMVKVPSITMLRKTNGLWERIWPLGDLAGLPAFEESLKNIDGITKALDEIIAIKEAVGMVYYLYVNEVVIYCHPNKQQDKEFHENIAKKFNKLRKESIE